MSFCHEQIAQFAHELALSPLRHRPRQVTGIARAIDLIDPAKEYPYSFVCFTITGYRPRRTADSLLTGKELIADLVELLDALTVACPLPVSVADGRLYDIDALARRLSVSCKTITRWRKRGLAGCWYAFDAGKPRLAFSSRNVQRFITHNRDLIQRGASFQLMGVEEKAGIIERARELVASQNCSLHVVTVRLAEETGRAVETIRYTLRRFDKDHPDLALFDRAEEAKKIDADTVIYEAFSAGDTIAALAQRFGKKRSEIERIITRARAAKIAANPIAYMYNPAFDAPDAESQILSAKLSGGDATADMDVTLARLPENLPPYLQELYRTPLLSKAQEADLFRRMNFTLHQAAVVRGRFAEDASKAAPRQLAEIDERLDAARQLKNMIIQANLRLVVSIAKRHLYGHPGANLFELVSDGNISLMKAVEKFDYAKGFAFSTYASWAIMRGFARSVPDELSHCDRYQTGCDEFLSAARDHRPIEMPVEDIQVPLRAALAKGLGVLDERERIVIRRRYGLDEPAASATLDEVGRELSLSKERVRQIEIRALAKMRSTLGDQTAALLAG